MNIQALETELNQPQYEDKTDAEVLSMLNDQSIESFVEPATPDLTNFLFNNGLYAKLLAAYRNPQVPLQIQVAAESGLDLAQSQIPNVNLQNPNIQLMLGALVQAGVWTQAEANSVLNFGRRTHSRASELFGADVTQADLDAMRLHQLLQPKLDMTRQKRAVLDAIIGQLEAGVDVDIEGVL
jgi:hypothetical protein